jgi:hypothetical protein
MEVQFTIKTPQQFADMVSFWYTIKTNPFFSNKDSLGSLLYQAIDAHLLNPEVVTKETVLEDVEELNRYFQKHLAQDPSDTDIQEQATTVKHFLAIVSKESNNTLFSSALCTPTEHFKEFCGPEWLTKQGKLSKRTAYEFFEQQCKIRKIRESNGKIYLNEWAQKLFQTGESEIYRTALWDHINGLFQHQSN